jgi:hypothetical protein
MAGAGRKWLIGCGAGCGGLILLLIVVTVGGGLVMMRPMGPAVDAQRELDERLGRRDDYRPGADVLSADRVERFLAVREAVMPMCADFNAMAEKFKAMDEMAESEKEPSAGQALRAVGGVTGGIFGLVGKLGHFAQRRNEALVAAEMGLGEYAWLYTVIYNSWLKYPTNTSIDDRAGRPLSGAERSRLREVTRLYGAALQAAGRDAEGAAWLAEAARMAEDDRGVPFADGLLPPEARAVLAPYESRLQALYCAATGDLEMSEIEKKGLSIHAD